MILLIPEWAHHYDELWNAIRRRNLWYIQLRFIAATGFMLFLLFSKFILNLEFSRTQNIVFFSTIFFMVGYNFLLIYLRKLVKPAYDKFNPLHLSLIQILFDWVSLTIIIYFTGTLDFPFYTFYLLHMIIGSLILPAYLIYLIAFCIVATVSSILTLEYYGVIPHQAIAGLNLPLNYQNPDYILGFIIFFSLLIFIIIFLTNSIARDLYQREQEIVQTLEKMTEQEKEKQKYVMGVVHEIKSPLTAAKSILEVVLNNFVGPLEKPVKDKLFRVEERIDEGIQLVNNILRISKLRLLNSISEELLCPDVIIKNLMSKICGYADSKGIKLEFTDRRQKQHCIKGDIVLIELAFSNLLNNAVKYIGFNGKVEVVLDETESDLVIDFCDNGIGIPPNEHERIFDEFYRASNIRKAGFEGTGLGLALVKQIITRHNGNIKVKSPSRLGNENKLGTSFIVNIPIVT